MIKAIITDFDGTLVDTFKANLRAYQKSFGECGVVLTEEKYRDCFGLRFDAFMNSMSVFDNQTAYKIKELKKEYYPRFFDHLVPNRSLLELIDSFHQMGGKTAIASTARKENLMNAVEYLGIGGIFDLIYAGADVKQGKPSPEIYLKVMKALGVSPDETLIFEDSQVGVEAAKASGAAYMIVSQRQFD